MYEFAINNWHWLLIGWLALSIPAGIFIGRFCSRWKKAEERVCRPLYPEIARKQERVIGLDDPDWKAQIEEVYRDHGGEG